VWMINAEKDFEDGSNVQVILSQPKENVFAGLNRHIDTSIRKNELSDAGLTNTNGGTKADLTLNNGTDTGHAFMMQGPDTITGVKNGFLNIAPDLMGVAARFAGGFGTLSELSALGMQNFTVSAFEGMKMGGEIDGTYTIDNYIMAKAMEDQSMLCTSTGTCNVSNQVTNTNYTMARADGANTLGTAISRSAWILPTNFLAAISSTAQNLGLTADPDGTQFDGLFARATDSTAGISFTKAINAMTGKQMLQHGFASQYDTNLADDKTDLVNDTAFDYMSQTTFFTFDAFVGGGSQYVYNMPTDGEVDLAARFKNSTKSGVNYSMNASYNYDKNPIINMSWRNAAGNKLVMNKVINQDSAPTVSSTATSSYSLTLADTIIADGVTMANSAYGGAAGQYATLRFTQEVKRVLNLGGSFDMAIETAALGPVVIRGEALYTKDGYSPIIDKTKLSYGDLVGALEMVKGNRLKYVLGADITALTNMMISFQYIEDRNLDFIDGTNRYTADYATMSMDNGFNKAIESKNFYSLFFSKPFGASGEHRWNNITMLEESANGNGKWNRLDAEFSIDDDTQATVEWNRYWGDTNSQFGQLDKSSNIQVGVKYSF